MKKKIFAVLMVFGLAAALCAQAAEKDKPLASVTLTRTDIISRSMFNKLVAVQEKAAKRSLTAEEKRAMLDKQITAIILTQQGDSDKLALPAEVYSPDVNHPMYVKAAAETGLSAKDVQFQLRLQAMSTVFLKSKQQEFAEEKSLKGLEQEFKLDNSDYEEMYGKVMSEFLRPLIMQFSYIAIDTTDMNADAKAKAKATMDEFAKQIKNGGSAAFDELVKKSKDRVDYFGGESQYLRKDILALFPNAGPKEKQFIDSIMGLKKFETSPVLEVSNVIMGFAIQQSPKPIKSEAEFAKVQASTTYIILKASDRREPVLVGIDEPLMPGQKTTPRMQLRQKALVDRALVKLVESLQGKQDDQGKTVVKGKAEIIYFKENFNW